MSNLTKRRIHLLANSSSGQGHGESIYEIAAKLCQEFGTELINYELNSPTDLIPQTKKALTAARDFTNDVIVAAGGDGTIRSVASEVRHSKTKMAIAPCGTFNFFARTHSVPEDLEQALRLALAGQSKPIRLGLINNEIFLNNCSLGIYAKSIAAREAHTKKFGRNQIIVIFSTIRSLLLKQRLMQVQLKSDGLGDNLNREIRTPMIFIGNNALQLNNLSLSTAKGFSKDKLAVITLKPVTFWEMMRVIFRGLSKSLENEERLNQFSTECLTIYTKPTTQRVALDGEMFMLKSPFEINSLPDCLNLIVPDEALKDTTT